jgi:PEP-CTERM/exosortase A-associated glycosyltransferase
LITAQARLRQSIAVVTGPLQQVDDPTASEIQVDEVPYFRTPFRGRFAQLALQRRWPLIREWQVVRLLRKRILELIDAHEVSIVYAHSPALCGLAGLQAARKRGLPFVYEIRAFWEDAAVDQERAHTTSWRYRLTRRLETYIAHNADAVSGIASHIIEELRARGIPQGKLFHVPNGVDADSFSPVDRDQLLASELQLPDAPVMGFFGSLYRYEGVAWLIQAAAELRGRGNRFTLLILGRGEEYERVRSLIQELEMQDSALLLGHVPHDQIKRYYSVVDIMVYPRLSARITELVTPLKPLEAMSLGKAVLGSDVGGIRELVKHEANGLLFRPENIEDFCFQAERLLTSPQLRAQVGQTGRETILREKDWNVLGRKYQTIYDYVLKNTGSSNGLIPRSGLGRQS